MIYNHEPDDRPTVIHCGVLIDGTGGAPEEDVALIIEGEHIAAIRPWRELDAAECRRSIDCSEATAIPGLIDGHAHLCLGTPDSGVWNDLETDPLGILTWGFSAVATALTVGITTVADCGSTGGLAVRVRDYIQAGLSIGPTVLAAGEALTTTAGHAGEISTIADNVDELRKAIRQRVVRKADFIKIMVTGGATDRYSNRRRAQYTTDELTEAIEDAHRLRRRVVGHANATEGIRRAVLAGIDVIAHCNWLGESPGTIDIDMEIVERMAIQGVQVDLNIEGACRPLSSPDGYPINWPTDRPEPTCRWELLQPLRDAGIPVYLSSDAYGSAIGAFPADVGNAAIQWNMAIETVLQYVTSIPADALGLDRRGRLVAGNVADIAVFAGDLRTDASLLSRQPQTYIRGKLVSRNGWLRPPTAALAHSEEASRHLTYMAAAHRQLD